MNKKILSIFIMIMALSLFGVSCSKDTPTKPSTPDTNQPGPDNGGGDPTPEPEPEPEIKDFVSITPSAGTASDKPIDFGTAANDTAKGLDLKLTVKPDGVKSLQYKIKNVEKDAEDKDANNVNAVLTKEHFSYNGAKLTISAEGATAVFGLEATKYNQVKVTITVSADGYNPKDVVVYAKFAK